MDWGQILNNTASFILSAETIGFMLAAIGLDRLPPDRPHPGGVRPTPRLPPGGRGYGDGRDRTS